MKLEKPLVVYDGECGFCVRWVERGRLRIGDRVDFAPFQRVTSQFPEVSESEFRRSVYLFEPDGSVFSGAEAVLRAMAMAPEGRPAYLLYKYLPGARRVSEAVYRFVAAHRRGISKAERLFVGRDFLTATYNDSRRFFLCGLAVCCLIAFLSLWSQVHGLIGVEGIQPASSQLETHSRQFGDAVFWNRPTLLRFSSGDAALHLLCGAGVLLSVLLLLDIAPALCLFVMGCIYVSMIWGAGPFLRFQWDMLLVEMMWIGAWYAPWRLRRRGKKADPRPLAPARWLLWWLLFRFMFESGAGKITLQDTSWWNLTALSRYYMTQPLPHGVSWFAHHLPLWFHSLSVLGMLFIEIILPLLILAPRRLRQVGCAGMLLLQLLMGATGNYGFFNLLTIVLCLTLLDDSALSSLRTPWKRIKQSVRARTCGEGGPLFELPPLSAEPVRSRPLLKRPSLFFYALLVVAISAVQINDLFPGEAFLTREQYVAGISNTYRDDGAIAAGRVLDRHIQPFFLVNSYGLFRTMTTSRPEIVIQGTSDGNRWVDYDFQWKPDDPMVHPRWVQPHMPRLDWQMWFEALRWESTLPDRPYPPSPWFAAFLESLLRNKTAVTSLIAENPFPAEPPMKIRLMLFDYRYTSPGERSESGAWWKRTQLLPQWLEVSLDDPQFSQRR